MEFPNTRAAGLDRLHTFLPAARLYARDRNFVRPGHPAVSRLSPLLRHRLLTEQEVASAAVDAHGFQGVEKFVQEVYWRRYWKAWLSYRPQVWREAAAAAAPADDARGDRARAVMNADSGNPVIDWFTRELIETGYLHNHSRMWFAAWWIHQAQLPWEWGAGFFMRHLLDGDPASNTLSWRWVAGLQTPGKTYLARRSNLEKYLDPAILAAVSSGLIEFDNPQPRIPDALSKPPVTRPEPDASPPPAPGRTGIWIHEDDLLAEKSPLQAIRPDAIIVTGHANAWNRLGYSDGRRKWIEGALDDTAGRATRHWRIEAVRVNTDCLATCLADWARAQQLQTVHALRPDVGPLDEDLPDLRRSLDAADVSLTISDRPEDLELRPLASHGFFQFWEKLRPRLQERLLI